MWQSYDSYDVALPPELLQECDECHDEEALVKTIFTGKQFVCVYCANKEVYCNECRQRVNYLHKCIGV